MTRSDSTVLVTRLEKILDDSDWKGLLVTNRCL